MFKLDDRFWSKVNKTESCWIWTGGKSNTGYGRFKIQGKLYSPHRLVIDCVDSKIDVCHSCDNPSCVNPEHLFMGTRKENMIDASVKGRLISKQKIYSSKKERRSASNRRYYIKHTGVV